MLRRKTKSQDTENITAPTPQVETVKQPRKTRAKKKEGVTENLTHESLEISEQPKIAPQSAIANQTTHPKPKKIPTKQKRKSGESIQQTPEVTSLQHSLPDENVESTVSGKKGRRAVSIVKAKTSKSTSKNIKNAETSEGETQPLKLLASEFEVSTQKTIVSLLDLLEEIPAMTSSHTSEEAPSTSVQRTPMPTQKTLDAPKPPIEQGGIPKREIFEDTEVLPIPTWRPKGTGAASTKPSLSKAEPQKKERKPDTKKQASSLNKTPEKTKEKEREHPTKHKERTPKVNIPKIPEIREIVSIPEDAPQIIMRDDSPTLVKKKQVYPPLMFFASVSNEKRLDIVLEEIKLASESGVHVFSHLIELETDPNRTSEAAGFAAYLLRKTVEVDPKAQVIFRVVLTAPDGWEKKYPKAKYITQSGGLAEPSICDEAFWSVAENSLAYFVEEMRKLEYRDSIMGIHLERGEWFYAEGEGYDTSVAAHEKFREWVRLRYRDDNVALCAAWFDGQVQFETVSIPEYPQKARPGEEFVRTGRKARRWVDYHLFLSDATVERISKLALRIKQASDGYFLVGLSYGYTFEWSHPDSGHLSLGKLLRTPEIDFVAGPPSYKNREPGQSAPFPCPIDSFALNGKMYISEEDFKTPISGRAEPDEFNPVMRTPQALENVHWRGIGVALAHSTGVCWMDSWGNGWLNSPGIWQRAEEAIRSLITHMAAPITDPDMTVFIDERSLAYLVDQRAFTLLIQNVREAALRCGLSVGFYLLSDLAHREHFPESKVYVFTNAWDIRPEVRSAIKTRLHRNGKLLFWLYNAGLFEGGRDSLERVREVTGIALKPQPFASKSGTTITNRRHPLCEALPEKLLAVGSALEPSFFAIPDEESLILGEYHQTGLPSLMVREFQAENNDISKWTSVFLGEPVVTPALFRALGQMAGAHIWNYQDDVTHVRYPFLTIHCTGTGPRTITLPRKCCAFDLLRYQWATIDSTHLKFNGQDGTTYIFLVGSKSEIEGMLSQNPAEILQVSEIPPRPENTIQLDSVHFDVPIMKLDQWIEEDTSETSPEDLIFKPAVFDLDFQPMEKPRQYTKKTIKKEGEAPRTKKTQKSLTNKKPKDTSKNISSPNQPFDAFGMNVVFRKRE